MARKKLLWTASNSRNKIGMDVLLEALKLYKARKKFNLEKLLLYAKLCRVEKVMKPYLESSI